MAERVTSVFGGHTDRDPRADRERRKLVNRIPPGTQIGKLLLVEPLGHPRVPLTPFRPDNHARVELAAIDYFEVSETAPICPSRSNRELSWYGDGL